MNTAINPCFISSCDLFEEEMQKSAKSISYPSVQFRVFSFYLDSSQPNPVNTYIY